MAGNASPICSGEFVKPTDPTHPMFNRPGRVTSVEYVGHATTGAYIISVFFDKVTGAPGRLQFFRAEELSLAPADEVASYYGDEDPA